MTLAIGTHVIKTTKKSELYLEPRSHFSFIELFKLLFIMELIHHGVHEVHV